MKVAEILREFGKPMTSNPNIIPFSREEEQLMRDANAYIEIGMRKKPAIIKFENDDGIISYRVDVHGHNIVEDNLHAAIKQFLRIKRKGW